MTFLWPMMLWLLLLVPLLVAAYIALLRRKRKAVVRYASLLTVKEALGAGPGWRRHVPPALLLGALTLILAAVARPAAIVTLPSERDTVILAMDVSGSMRAADVEPDRLTASQTAAKAFVAEQPRTTRLGVVAFAGTAMTVQQPTLNRDDVVTAIDRFQLQRGTNIGSAILVSLQTIFPGAEFDLPDQNFRRFRGRGRALNDPTPEPVPERFLPVEPGSYQSAVIILLTDGQATTGPDPVEAARMAADRGVRVFTVGFGSQAGETVGFGGWSMRVQLDEDTLRQVAEVTRARYFHASSSDALTEVYRELTSEFVMETDLTEITAFFAAAAGLLTLLSAVLSMVWFGRIA
ncbi:MAG: VWA domain-containing protein [Vicinamibacterales bacterium]|nr:VWA domain-containing protein [Vicinamibacterales bacterium]